MSIFASILRSVYKLSGAKKAFALPEDALRKEIEKQNRHRGVFTPTDRKAYYETIAVNGFPCLIVREHPKPSERAILYFFGGGMVIGPDKGDLPVMRKLCRETGCDVWFPFYPLCMEHCITETYAMVYECYRKMIELYGGGNVNTCGFSSAEAECTFRQGQRSPHAPDASKRRSLRATPSDPAPDTQAGDTGRQPQRDAPSPLQAVPHRELRHRGSEERGSSEHYRTERSYCGSSRQEDVRYGRQGYPARFPCSEDPLRLPGSALFLTRRRP